MAGSIVVVPSESVRDLRQIVRAVEIEHALRKADILALYLTLAPYGGTLEGVRAASLAYFGKEPRKLSLAEAALLVALPQSPELRRPDRSPETARAARDRVLDRIAAAGVAPRDEIARAKTQSVPRERKQLPMLAPHAADQVVLHEPDKRVHGLTIDLPLQKSLQDLAFERARTLGPDISVAVLAVDNASGEVRARAGPRTVAFANEGDPLVVSGRHGDAGPIWWRSFARSAQRQSSVAPTCGMREKCGA